jgi:dipeptidyl aminopeptidase/acylaminoacyl peptidase
MKKIPLLFAGLSITFCSISQNRMTPELLWQLGRVSGVGISRDGKNAVYKVVTPNVAEDKSSSKTYSIPIEGGDPTEITDIKGAVGDHNLSPDWKYVISTQEVKIKKVFGKDFYPELDKSKAQIYDGLNYRHWDEWEDGSFSHLILNTMNDGRPGEPTVDLAKDQPYDCPQKPFGGDEDFTWSPDSKMIVYTDKKRFGTDYAISTNTDLYAYTLATGVTTNLTEGMAGYDTHPSYSLQGALAWLSMRREGYEADKNDLIVRIGKTTTNLTASWDETVHSFIWSTDGKKLYFNAAVDGTMQLFEVETPTLTKKKPDVKQITKGDFDVSAIIGQSGTNLIVTRTDMNHAAEVYSVNLLTSEFKQLTHVNDAIYKKMALSKTERRMVTTTDGQQMLVWVIYPPDFNPSKKYPALLYCQGGPQSALTQFYSFRWNFQLMAANGYIVVAPNRRGMPGHGVTWNEQISKDHGGQAIKDYLSASDDISREPFIDKSRIGCVGASYGGYSVFYLAGVHQNRFKTFIAHDGIFDLKSMYGSTEELWFVNWDYGGPYWEKMNAAAQKSYSQFDPLNFVDQWNKPILVIHGGKDYRVPLEQGLEAFQVAQLKGLKSRLLYFPEENHWIMHAQNAIVWQREFFKWLSETL